MPMSWSIAAAHSSSRSPAAGSHEPGRRTASRASAARARPRARRGAGRPRRATARLRTASPRTSAEQRLAPGEQRPGEEHPLAQAGLGDLERRRTRPRSSTVCSVSAAARMMSPRPGLIPGMRPRSATGSAASSSTSSARRRGGQHEALHADVGQLGAPLGGGGEVAGRAADRHQPAAGVPQPAELARALAHVRAQALDRLARGPAVAGEEPLGQPHRPERQRDATAVAWRSATRDELQAAAAELHHRAVGQRRGVDRGDVAVAGLGLGAQHLDLQPRALPRGAAAGRPGWRHRGSRWWPRRRCPPVRARAPGRSGRTPRASPARARSRPAESTPVAAEPLADPDRLVELVGPLPPRAGQEGEDDQPPRVRPEIDDRGLPVRGALPWIVRQLTAEDHRAPRPTSPAPGRPRRSTLRRPRPMASISDSAARHRPRVLRPVRPGRRERGAGRRAAGRR